MLDFRNSYITILLLMSGVFISVLMIFRETASVNPAFNESIHKIRRIIVITSGDKADLGSKEWMESFFLYS
jgi:hypothetical protein